jgi:hypothetical protein
MIATNTPIKTILAFIRDFPFDLLFMARMNCFFAVFVIIFRPPGFTSLFAWFASVFLGRCGCFVAFFGSNVLFLPDEKTALP